MSLEKFISHVKQIGLNQGSRFELIIPDGPSSLSFLCNATNLPGLTIMTNELRYFGENIERPHGAVYQPINVSFYLDNNLTAKKFFDSWLNRVFNQESRFVGFYDSYTKDVTLNLLDKNDRVISSTKLIQAYPKSVGDIQLDMSNTGTQVFSAVIVYKWWEDALKEKSTTADYSNIETSGNITYSTETGYGNLLDFGSLTPNSLSVYSEMGLTGKSIIVDSARYTSQAETLFGASGITSSTIPGINGQFSSNAASLGSGFFDLGTSINQMSETLADITAPVAAMSTAIGTISGTLGAIGNLVGAVGGDSSKITRAASSLSQAAGALGTVSQLNGIPGHLRSVSANMSSVNAAIKEVSSEIKSTNTSYDAPADSAFSKLASTFASSADSISKLSTII